MPGEPLEKNLQMPAVGTSTESSRFEPRAPRAAAPIARQPVEIEAGGLSLVPLGEETVKAVPIGAPRRVASAPEAARIRDRYILARFPGVMSKSEDLADTGAVIKAARLYFEDGLAARGLELLQLASELDATREGVWLARLQMHFLLRDASGFADTAAGMRQPHFASSHWSQVAELGQNLGIPEAFFAGLGIRSVPALHPGHLPPVPDWLQSERDLTPEVAAAQLHSRLLMECGSTTPQGGMKDQS